MKNTLKYLASLFFGKIRSYLKEGKINEYKVNLPTNLICRKYLLKLIKKKKSNLLKATTKKFKNNTNHHIMKKLYIINGKKSLVYSTNKNILRSVVLSVVVSLAFPWFNIKFCFFIYTH